MPRAASSRTRRTSPPLPGPRLALKTAGRRPTALAWEAIQREHVTAQTGQIAACLSRWEPPPPPRRAPPRPRRTLVTFGHRRKSVGGARDECRGKLSLRSRVQRGYRATQLEVPPTASPSCSRRPLRGETGPRDRSQPPDPSVLRHEQAGVRYHGSPETPRKPKPGSASGTIKRPGAIAARRSS